jgi:hypothetical protein
MAHTHGPHPRNSKVRDVVRLLKERKDPIAVLLERNEFPFAYSG